MLTAEEKLGELSHDRLFWLVCVAQSTTACIDISRWAACSHRWRCVAERQTKQIGQVVRNAIKSNRSLGGKTLKSIEGVFKAIDKDGSGDLDHNEFKMAMDRLGLGLSNDQIVQCIEVLDTDGDGEVSLDVSAATVGFGL